MTTLGLEVGLGRGQASVQKAQSCRRSEPHDREGKEGPALRCPGPGRAEAAGAAGERRARGGCERRAVTSWKAAAPKGWPPLPPRAGSGSAICIAIRTCKDDAGPRRLGWCLAIPRTCQHPLRAAQQSWRTGAGSAHGRVEERKGKHAARRQEGQGRGGPRWLGT